MTTTTQGANQIQLNRKIIGNWVFVSDLRTGASSGGGEYIEASVDREIREQFSILLPHLNRAASE